MALHLLGGVIRDGYDIFSIDKKYHLVLDLAAKAKKIINDEIVTLNYNVNLFEDNLSKIESMMTPYLRKPVSAKAVLKFLKNLRGVLSG